MKSTTINIMIIGSVLLGVIYALSAPAKQKMDKAYEDLTEWTDERKARDPLGYLDFAEKEANQVLEVLDASQFTMNSNWGQFTREGDDVNERLKIGRQTLAELKDIYRQVETDDDLSFPQPYDGQMRGERWFRESIVNLQSSLEDEALNQGYVRAAQERLQAETRKVDRLRQDAQQEIRNVKMARREIEVNRMSEGVHDRLNEIEGFLEALKGTVRLSLTNEPMSLDRLVERKRYDLRFNDERFKKIMAE